MTSPIFLPYRPRRLRQNESLRRLVRENRLDRADFVAPIFIAEGESDKTPIATMPGVFRYGVRRAVEEARGLAAKGLGAVILFGVPEAKSKDSGGRAAFAVDGLIPRAIAEIKAALPHFPVIADVCLCEYTDHGHCGVVNSRGEVENDATLPLLAQTALAYASAGADIVAPSDMMDGRVGFMRRALDAEGFSRVPMMSYAVKHASAFYGPFREAAQSTPQFGDRKSYQMDPANLREAIREAALDVGEGADILLVKPALSNLDIIHALRARFDLPVAAYQVSGEYAMLKAASAAGFLDEKASVLESLMAIKRAGASLIISYFAGQVAEWL